MSSYGPYVGDTYEGSPEESHDMEAEAAAAFAQSMEAENVDAMAEQDERTIYRWILGHEIAENHLPYPPLDMNFAFDVCVPRLRIEHFQVDIWTYEGEGKPFGVRIHGYIGNGNFAKFVRLVDTSLREAFYDALLAYIKGNTNA